MSGKGKVSTGTGSSVREGCVARAPLAPFEVLHGKSLCRFCTLQSRIRCAGTCIYAEAAGYLGTRGTNRIASSTAPFLPAIPAVKVKSTWTGHAGMDVDRSPPGPLTRCHE